MRLATHVTGAKGHGATTAYAVAKMERIAALEADTRTCAAQEVIDNKPAALLISAGARPSAGLPIPPFAGRARIPAAHRQ